MPTHAIIDALLLSLAVAAVATCVAGIAGGWMGRYLARHRTGWGDLLDGLTSLPLFLPPTVLGYYLTLLLGRNRPLGHLLSSIGIEITFTWTGAAIAGAIVAFPLMVRSARLAFESIEPDVEDSASIDGAGEWQRWIHVILPLTRSGLIGGLVLSFARAIGEFGATLMVGGNIPGKTQTMPLAIYEAYAIGDDSTALLLSIILTLVSLVVVVVGLRLGRERTGTTLR